jgi:hypothetical protein
MDNFTKEEILYIYNMLIKQRDKLEDTDSLFVLGVSLNNQKELDMVYKMMAKIYENQTITIGQRSK